MEKASYKLVYNRKNTLNKLGQALVHIEVCLDRKQRFISSGVYLKPNQWKEGAVIKHPNAGDLNKYLRGQIAKLEEFELNTTNFTLNSIDRYLGKTHEDSFPGFFKHFFESNESIRKSTKLQYRSTYKHIMAFGGLKYYKELTYENIRGFDNYLASKGLSKSTSHGIHKRVKAVIKEALNRDLITKNPYDKFKFKKPPNGKINYLTPEELKKLEKKKMPIQRLDQVKDIFLFCCYTGLSYSDVYNLTENDIFPEDGEHWIQLDRGKTDVEYTVMLLPKALKIIEKYKGNSKLLPVISNQKINAFLKEIAIISEVNKNLHFHMSRHTCGMMLVNEGIPIEIISKILGHSDIKITQEYSKVLKRSIIKEMTKLKDK